MLCRQAARHTNHPSMHMDGKGGLPVPVVTGHSAVHVHGSSKIVFPVGFPRSIHVGWVLLFPLGSTVEKTSPSHSVMAEGCGFRLLLQLPLCLHHPCTWMTVADSDCSVVSSALSLIHAHGYCSFTLPPNTKYMQTLHATHSGQWGGGDWGLNSCIPSKFVVAVSFSWVLRLCFCLCFLLCKAAEDPSSPLKD